MYYQAEPSNDQLARRAELEWHTENMLREMKRRLYRPTSYWEDWVRYILAQTAQDMSVIEYTERLIEALKRRLSHE